jgi:hypothetical protein
VCNNRGEKGERKKDCGERERLSEKLIYLRSKTTKKKVVKLREMNTFANQIVGGFWLHPKGRTLISNQ